MARTARWGSSAPIATPARLNRSCDLLCIPRLDPALVQQSFSALIGVDQDWVPTKRGTALYIRPTVIATETFLGVHPSHSYLYYVILSPVGAYYKEGLNPVKILATDQYVRAVPGGLGAAKTAGNYAASLFAAQEGGEETATPKCYGSTAATASSWTRSAP